MESAAGNNVIIGFSLYQHIRSHFSGPSLAVKTQSGTELWKPVAFLQKRERKEKQIRKTT